MERHDHNSVRFAGLRLLVFTLAMIGGCPPEQVDSGLVTGTGISAGTYWAQYDADTGALAVLALPQVRGDEGEWCVLDTAPPVGYTGPAVYEILEDGSWVRLTTDGSLTLDEVLQVYDPAPQVDAAGVAEPAE